MIDWVVEILEIKETILYLLRPCASNGEKIAVEKRCMREVNIKRWESVRRDLHLSSAL